MLERTMWGQVGQDGKQQLLMADPSKAFCQADLAHCLSDLRPGQAWQLINSGSKDGR